MCYLAANSNNSAPIPQPLTLVKKMADDVTHGPTALSTRTLTYVDSDIRRKLHPPLINYSYNKARN